jgi:ABC-type uncharacterized transport system ATPase subunit
VTEYGLRFLGKNLILDVVEARTGLARAPSSKCSPPSSHPPAARPLSGHYVVRDKNAVRSSIDVVFQDQSLDNMLTGRENLDFHGRMYGMDGSLRKERVEEVLKLVDLTDKVNVKVEDYSGGMKRRLEIARRLMHFPNVLFLDEPTWGWMLRQGDNLGVCQKDEPRARSDCCPHHPLYG